MTEHNLEDELNESEKWLVDGLNELNRLIPEVITENYTIKSGVYDVDHDIRVENCKLTIEKGVTLNFGIDKKLYIGKVLYVGKGYDNTSQINTSQIVTEGTKSAPVILQAKMMTWNGITINNTKTDNILRYTYIRDGNKFGFDGGGIDIENSLLSLEDCVIEKCEATHGGGIYNNRSSCVRMKNTIITENHANWTGGGIETCYNSFLRMENTTISKNHAEKYGGGMCNWESTVRMENTTITENHAKENSGGIYSYDSKILKYGKNTIENNTPDNIREDKITKK